MKKTLRFVLPVLVALTGQFVYAQGSITLTPEEQQGVLTKNAKSVNPALQSAPISALSSVNLASLFNDTRAEIKVALTTPRSVFNVGVAQSFSSKPKIAKLFDATGLSTGTTFSLAWQTRLGNIIVPKTTPIRDLARFNAIKSEYRRKKGLDSTTPISLEMLDDEYRAKVLNSNVVDLTAFASPVLFSVQFSASRVGFDYIPDASATQPSSTNQTNKSFSLGLSRFASLDVYYALSYTISYVYQSGEDVITYSFPVGTQGLSYTKDVTVGEPIERVENRLKAELRQLFRRSDDTPMLGINPNISALFRGEKINVDVPVYFITNDDKGLFNNLQAGFRIGYTSPWDDSFLRDLGSLNSDKMYFSLFLSKPFSISN